jgi:Nucleoside-diphosphate-sugar pyrophosphorylase involved in lipopolysaccharide biosynthesis/translation initiation factor 2B, gamma/epsilon subunits (eIF-2Bgamma/eIF-2Bepsilon)
MRAMILAAGVGSRLDPLTRNLPKPLVPIVNRPVMEHIVELLRKHGFNEIMVNLHYLGDQIEQHFGDGSKLGVKIHYSREDQLWGDAGSVKRVEEFFRDETFIVVGGDDLADMDLTRLVKTHRDKRALSTIALSLVDDPSEYGIVQMNEEGRITRFLEKPKGEVIFSNTANTGVYVFEPDVFDLIPKHTFYLFGKTFFPQMLEQRRPLYGHLTASYWKDVGNLEVYRQTHTDCLAGRVSIKFPMQEVRKFVWIGENCEIDETAEIAYPVVIGNNCLIEAGARVLENTVLGNGCAVERGAVVKESILWDGATAMRDTWLERCVVGRDCKVKTNAAIFDGVIVDPLRKNGGIA